MNIAGFEKKGLDQGVLTIQRRNGATFDLTFTALPIGFTDEMEKELVPPSPPREGFCRDHRGRFIKDNQGRPVPFYDKENPEYLQQCKTINRLQTTAFLAKALENDQNISWEARREDTKSMKEYYEKIYQEIRDFGFSAGELTDMINYVLEISKLGGTDIDEAREDFLG
jgi:hypothetical protein